jgi:hypothetical protein
MARKNPKLVESNDLFHVKLDGLMGTRRLTNADLARQLPGVPHQMVQAWRTGKKMPNGTYMAWLLQVLDVRPDQLCPLPQEQGAQEQPRPAEDLGAAVERMADALRVIASASAEAAGLLTPQPPTPSGEAVLKKRDHLPDVSAEKGATGVE